MLVVGLLGASNGLFQNPCLGMDFLLMFNKILSLAVGYATYWALNTPSGRDTMKKAAKGFMADMGFLENKVFSAVKKNIAEKKGGTNEDGTHPQNDPAAGA